MGEVFTARQRQRLIESGKINATEWFKQFDAELSKLMKGPVSAVSQDDRAAGQRFLNQEKTPAYAAKQVAITMGYVGPGKRKGKSPLPPKAIEAAKKGIEAAKKLNMSSKQAHGIAKYEISMISIVKFTPEVDAEVTRLVNAVYGKSESVEPLGEEMSYQGLIVYAKRAIEGWDEAAGALETLRHTVPTTVSEDYVRESFKLIENVFGKALDSDRGKKILEGFEVSAWKAKKAALGD